MSTDPLLRVSNIQVEGLFDVFDHRVDLRLEDRVTILHGPNGVGKTMVLKMVDDLLAGRYTLFRQIPFRRFMLEFTDGSYLELTARILSAEQKTKNASGLRLTFRRDGEAEESHDIPVFDENLQVMAMDIANGISWLRRVGSDQWIDEREGEILSADELVGRYADVGQTGSGSIPEWLSRLRNTVAVHLIEAQRLLRLGLDDSRVYRPRARTRYRVLECALGLHNRMSETMARYGQKSQQLDQTFPQRLLTHQPAPLSRDEIKKHMDDLDRRRSALKELGILDELEVHPFDLAKLDTLDKIQQGVMSLYVQDTSQKLEVLADLAQRVRLLLDIVNHKFLHKRIRIDREVGLIAERKDGTQLKLEALSSGEQHELVMHYDLLFRVRPNTLVLIDEPELSLHVAWQKRFLPDLLEIVATARFDAVIATHSPYIVGDRSDLMIGLNADLV